MVITLDMKTLGMALIIIGLLVLIVFCIVFVKNLIITIQHTNQILKDAEKISAIAAERSEQVDGLVGDVAESVGQVTDAIKGNQSIPAALTSLVNAVTALKNLVTGKDNKKEK